MQTAPGPAVVPQVRLEQASLDLRHPLVGRRQIPPETGIAASDPGELLHVLQGTLHDEPTRRGRAREVADRVVEVEEKRAGELPDVVEIPFRGGPLPAGDSALAHRLRHGAHHERRREPGGRHARLVAGHELSRAIRERVLARPDRPALEVAADVLGQLLDRGVAALRLLAQRRQDDVVAVALQARNGRAGPRAAPARDTARATSP